MCVRLLSIWLVTELFTETTNLFTKTKTLDKKIAGLLKNYTDGDKDEIGPPPQQAVQWADSVEKNTRMITIQVPWSLDHGT